MVSHLMAVIPMQILVEKIAKLKHINPDMPRNLAKTVTV
jgi:glucosamine 6-phosphate synthetase-like amidotransferase/phosphosugar isomerase protein